jgi:hypothetical protein
MRARVPQGQFANGLVCLKATTYVALSAARMSPPSVTGADTLRERDRILAVDGAQEGDNAINAVYYPRR